MKLRYYTEQRLIKKSRFLHEKLINLFQIHRKNPRYKYMTSYWQLPRSLQMNKHFLRIGYSYPSMWPIVVDKYFEASSNWKGLADLAGKDIPYLQTLAFRNIIKWLFQFHCYCASSSIPTVMSLLLLLLQMYSTSIKQWLKVL